jgi:phage N-6-adenine-methyltransferase
MTMLLGFKAQNHPQQTYLAGVKNEVDDRALPEADFEKLNLRFGFTIDAAAATHNRKLERFYSIENSGLLASWAGERVYCNPPFSNIRPWIEKAWLETDCPLIVMLLPANRTEQTWWQALVEPTRDRPGSPLRVEFLPGRMRFLNPGETGVKPNSRPPFGCCLLIWNRTTP